MKMVYNNGSFVLRHFSPVFDSVLKLSQWYEIRAATEYRAIFEAGSAACKLSKMVRKEHSSSLSVSDSAA